MLPPPTPEDVPWHLPQVEQPCREDTPASLEIVSAAGAADVGLVNALDQPVDAVLELTGGEGVDAVFETVCILHWRRQDRYEERRAYAAVARYAQGHVA